MIFLKKIVWGAFEYVADSLKIIKFDPACLVLDYAAEILIAQPKLNVKPIFRFALFVKDIKDSQSHYITPTLYNVLIIPQIIS